MTLALMSPARDDIVVLKSLADLDLEDNTELARAQHRCRQVATISLRHSLGQPCLSKPVGSRAEIVSPRPQP